MIKSIIIRCTNSIGELLAWFAGTLLVSAFLFSKFESISLWNAFYWACVTATSTGFGDISPKTVLGQALAICLMFFSLFFILPLFIAYVVNTFVVNHDAWTHGEQERVLNDTAASRMLLERLLAMYESRDKTIPEPKIDKSWLQVGDWVRMNEGLGYSAFGHVSKVFDGDKYEIAMDWGGGVIYGTRIAYGNRLAQSSANEARAYYTTRAGKLPPEPSSDAS